MERRYGPSAWRGAWGWRARCVQGAGRAKHLLIKGPDTFSSPFSSQAGDTDGDLLTYSLPVAPAGMTISSAGLVSWRPTGAQLGNNSVQVRVADTGGLAATQSFTINVTEQAVNHPPVITSTPVLSATVGQVYYAYNVQGSDPDNDPLSWSLTTAPAGMSINGVTGTIRWTPLATQVGSQAVTVRLVDNFGGVATQSFTVTVRGVNLPPVITSTPVTTTPPGTYTYAVQASDADGDALTYAVSGLTPGTTVSAAGLITGTKMQLGTYTVTVTVSDRSAGDPLLLTATQTYTLTVAGVNHPPLITSQPPVTAVVGAAYQYQVAGSDPDTGETLTYSLSTDVPSGFTSQPGISSTSGLVSWTSPQLNGGNNPSYYHFTVTLSDGTYQAVQSYTLKVGTNSTPTITSAAVKTVTAGLAYRYDVQANDADGDPLTYALSGMPAGMTIDGNGRITWSPGIPQIGTYNGITVTVTDPFGAAATQTYNLTVTADTTPPTIELQISPSSSATAPLPVGTLVTFLVFASDNVGVTSLKLTVGTTNVPLDSKGQAQMTMTTAGNFTVTAVAGDAAGNTTTAPLQTVYVNNPSGTPPTIQLGTGYPAADAIITAPTAAFGATVSDDHLGVKYDLWAIPFDGSPSKLISTSNGFVSTSSLTFSTTLDPTLLANGDYTLDLRATDADDNLTTVVDRHISIQANLKLGRETLSVTDLTIPVAGIPITVVRTYDSLNAGKSMDFGYGWQLSYGDAQLKVDLVPGSGQTWGDFPAFTDGTHVYVTMPGGQREGFTFTPWPEGQLYGALIYWHPAFTPDPGVIDQLTVPDVLLSQDGNQYFTIETTGLNTYNPADPIYGDQYTLKIIGGTGYEVAADTGKLFGMTARNGNSLALNDTGITSNTGKTVTFTRDPAGHIVAITDPRGNSVKYAYDANGNLVSVTDRANDPPTAYTYDPNHPHFLAGVIDPLGVQVMHVTFNQDGRVQQASDAAGNPVNFTYDTSALTEAISDPQTPPTTLVFNPRGDVTQLTDSTGAQRLATFNNTQPADVDVPDTVTQVRRNMDGSTTSFTAQLKYNGTGEVTSNTTPMGAVTRETYNGLGEPTTLSTALGDTVANSYDSNGNLLSTVTAAGTSSSYSYDSHNNMTEATNGNGTSFYSYDSSGSLATNTTPTGVTTSLNYDANGNPVGTSVNWVNPANPADVHTVTTSAVFDPDDRETKTVDAYGNASQARCDVKGRATQTLDVLNNVTSYVYSSRDQVIQTSYPDGTITDTFYDTEGRATYADDAHVPGQADVRGTHTIFDSSGRVTETDRVDGLVITVTTSNGVSSSQVQSAGTVLSRMKTTFNDLGQVTQKTDAAGQPTLYQYDADGRETAVTDALSETVSTSYDAAGRLASTTDGAGHITQYVYNADGKTLKTIFADGTFTQVSYDNEGRQISQTDQMGSTTKYQYDAEGRITAVLLPTVVDPQSGNLANATTYYAYDAYDDPTQIRDAKGQITQFTFDQFGNQLTQTLPMGQVESTSYDAFGRQAMQTDFKGQNEVLHYDSLGRVDTKTFYAAGSSTPGETLGYQFDGLDRLSQVNDTLGSSTRITQYGHDLDNRITSLTTPEGTINYVFDQATGFHTRTYSANSDITYTQDALERVKSLTVTKQNGVTLVTPLVTTYFYTPVDRVDHIVYPNGTETDYGYDSLNRVTSVTNKASTTLLSSYAYTLEPDGLRTGVTERQLEADGSYSTVTVGWTYDALKRMTQEAYTSTISSNSYNDQYVYDLVGNRLSHTHTAGGQTAIASYVYNQNDELTSESGTLNGASSYQTSYGYDANGALTSAVRTGSGAETDGYAFDLQNRLSTANVSRIEGVQSIVIAASYTYDDIGFRSQSIVTTTIGSGSPTTTATQYLIDPVNPVGYSEVLEEHTNGSSMPSVSYVLGLSVLAQADASGATSYLLPDGLGSTRLLVAAAGTISARYAYDAYGSLLNAFAGIVSPPATRILYAGQQFDPALQQYYLRARFYSPSNGRFTRRDPFGGDLSSPQSLNKYAYVGGNPVNYIDPSGRQLSEVLSTIGEFIGEIGKAISDLSLLAYCQFTAFLVVHPIIALTGHIILTSALWYSLLFRPQDRDVFLALFLGDPMGTVEALSGDLVSIYQQAKNLFAVRFNVSGLINEGNDVLSSVGSNVHPNVPPYTGGKTRGVFRYNDTEVPLISKDSNPGQWLTQNLEGGAESGLNAIVPTHVEGHAAAIMNKYDIMNADLFINQAPCPKGGMCRYVLSKLLPSGSQLRVHFLADDGISVHTWLFRAGEPRWTVLE